MKIWLLAAAGCVSSPTDYPVIATAHLEALDSAVSGPLEIIGTSEVAQDHRYLERMLVAYGVTLPDTAPRRVRLYDATSCMPRDDLRVLVDLQAIRRVGDETHFVIRDIDVETIIAPVSLDPEDSRFYAIGRIAVVQELDGADGAPGAWLACGVFRLGTQKSAK